MGDARGRPAAEPGGYRAHARQLDLRCGQGHPRVLLCRRRDPNADAGPRHRVAGCRRRFLVIRSSPHRVSASRRTHRMRLIAKLGP